jgi:predicted DNA-binding transcriptional regulator AlpA
MSFPRWVFPGFWQTALPVCALFPGTAARAACRKEMTMHLDSQRSVRTPEAAAILGLSKSTLEKLRLRGNGPKYAKLGRICVYSPRDLEAWVVARSRNSTSEPAREF